jgi:hypothetical protein
MKKKPPVYKLPIQENIKVLDALVGYIEKYEAVEKGKLAPIFKTDDFCLYHNLYIKGFNHNFINMF